VGNLINTIETHHAVMVRGRYQIKTDDSIAAKHYDLGPEICYAVPNTEGISIWRRQCFLDHGGFDTLLSGWEGVALWSKMYPYYGPEGFLYTPDAAMLHDFAKNQSHLLKKKKLHRSNVQYLNQYYPDALRTKKLIDRIGKQRGARLALNRAAHTIKSMPPLARCSSMISILTTAKNVQPYLDDFTKGLKNQTFKNFEVLFVDEGSTDGTDDKISSLWRNDTRLHMLRGSGRAESLNLAIASAKNDICIIADAADISHPQRFEVTLRYLFSNPTASCISVETFNRHQIFGNTGLEMPFSAGMRTGCLLGQPRTICSLGFRKTLFPVAFDDSMGSGFEFKWLYENLRHGRHDGMLVPLNQVYSTLRPKLPESAYWAHEDIVGPLTEKDKWCIGVLCGVEIARQTESLAEVQDYITRLLILNADIQFYDQIELEQVLSHRFTQLERASFEAKYKGCKKEVDRLHRIIGEAISNNDHKLNAARRAVECYPDNTSFQLDLANLLQHRGKHHEAEAAYLRAIDIKPDLGSAHRGLSIVLARQNRLGEALVEARRAIESDRENAENHHHIGNLLQTLKKTDEAKIAYLRAIELKSDLGEAHYKLSAIFSQSEHQNDALAAARRAVECDPENAEFHVQLGDLLQRGGAPKQAEDAYRRATELKPGLGRAHRESSNIFAHQNRPTEALAAARRAEQCDPNIGKVHHYFGTFLESCRRLIRRAGRRFR
jgi:tetratricopeptide (TPR) repeat protein